MYRLRSNVDDSLTRDFECFEDMQGYVSEHTISADDATMEEWIDDRIDPANSGYREVQP